MRLLLNLLLSLLLTAQPIQTSISKVGLSSLATLATADFQTLIGDQGLNEGGFAHAGLHGLVGCISAAATGADCAAGALGGVVQSIYAGTLEGKGPAREDYASDEAYAAAYGTWEAKVGQTANLIGGVVGYALSGGSAANVSATASIAKSGILNNYLWHQQAYMLEQAKSDLAACEVGGGCSDEELARHRERIAYFEELDAFTDQQLRGECSGDPASAMCQAYVADALCAAESRSTALCGGAPGFGVERWGYRSPNEIYKANMFASGRDYMAGFGIAYANLQHQQDTLDLLAEFADSVNAVRGNDSIGIAIEMGVVAVGAGVVGRIPKGGMQALASSFGERQFQLSRADLEGVLSGPSALTLPDGVPYFRVEGGGSGVATSRNALVVNADGTVSIVPGCTGAICVSVGNADHAVYYLTNKRPDGSVVVFEVDRATHNRIMGARVPQFGNSGASVKVTDIDTPGMSIELNQAYSELMASGSSNGRVLTQQEFINEFGGN